MSTRVYATVVATPRLGYPGQNPVASCITSASSPASPSRREVRVAGRAELHGSPDRARLGVRVRSAAKGEATEAERSAARRADYVESRVRQAAGVKAEDVTVLKSLDRVDGLYVMTVEVVTEFSDFQAMQALRNQLVVKLDSRVDVRPPVYHLTASARDSYRRQACLLAVGSARRKAGEVCRLLGLSLGRPLSVHELPDDGAAAAADFDWPSPAAVAAPDKPCIASSASHSAVPSLRENVEAAAEVMRCSVVATFELRDKSSAKRRR